MNRILLILFIGFSFLTFGQSEANVFDDAGVEETFEPSKLKTDYDQEDAGLEKPKDTKTQQRPGNPGRPVAIDGALPLLLLGGLALIVFFTRKQKNINI